VRDALSLPRRIGPSRARERMRRVPPVLAALVVCSLAPRAFAANVWLERRPLNQAHAGGDLEAPHSTMYAFKTAVARGADMLEMDVRLTADGHLVVQHDDDTRRTTEATRVVRATPLAELQALDNAYWFFPDCWSCRSHPPDAYTLRGIRTGDRPPPPGFAPDDFRIPTLREVLETFPDRLLDIEIKGSHPADAPAAHRLAELLTEYRRTDDVLVVSFDDALVSEFKQAAPAVHTSPGLNETIGWFLGRGALPHHKSIQVPPTFSGTTVVTADLVADAHANDLAVHVWLEGVGQENDAFLRGLLDLGVDGIIAGKPALLQGTLEDRGTVFETPLELAAEVLGQRRRAVQLPLLCPPRTADRCTGVVTLEATVPGGAVLARSERVDLARGQAEAPRFRLGRRWRIRHWPEGELDATVRVEPGNQDTAATEMAVRLTR
jgi:glycerophosphoryl diester phosphodiesterase